MKKDKFKDHVLYDSITFSKLQIIKINKLVATGRRSGCDYNTVEEGRCLWWCNSSVVGWWWLHESTTLAKCHRTIHNVSAWVLLLYYNYEDVNIGGSGIKDTQDISVLSLWCVLSCFSRQSCPTLCDPTACSLPGSSVHGVLQARILERAAMPSSRGASWPRGQICISSTGQQVLFH